MLLSEYTYCLERGIFMSNNKKAAIWEEEIIIPTYKIFPPEKSPMFIEKRAYQGSSGKVYPFPVVEKISNEKEDVKYKVVFLENEFLKVMIIPELGGRIQRATDKTNNYDFVYYNHVIKPALVGLTGPWISGGIEFNWPQHHRPSTYSPVDYYYESNEDGSVSVYLSEIDKMYGTKGMAKISLYPEKSYIEIEGKFFNRTDTPQTFLWWANPAVPVNDYTYSVFPPDVNAVMDHGKRAVSTFPIATGEYYKYDYSEGIDISMYKNIKVPTSYMAAHSDFDFIGNYDENLKAGLLHVADHHISPGKKQWTWGNSDFGVAWDRSLTDEDGPYIELMTGVYTDNQPDFTWLKPYEEKTFVQYFMPYKGVGRVKNATKDIILNCEISGTKGTLVIYSTGIYENTIVKIKEQEDSILEKTLNLSPNKSEEIIFELRDGNEKYSISVYDNLGNLLLEHTPYEKKLEKVPDAAEAIDEPKKLKSTEELFLAASHLEQYRHATYDPADYYLEGLRRDPTDIRLNNGYGMVLLKRGHFKEAKKHFEKAIEKQTWKNPNPYYGECYFNLGLSLELLGEDEKAYDAFYKAIWSYETQSGGFYHLSALSSKKHDYFKALDFANQSIIKNWHNMKSRNLKAALLRKLKHDNTSFIEESLSIDRLDIGSLYEESLNKKDFEKWLAIMGSSSKNFLELALDYIKFGFYDDALFILKKSPSKDPMLYYYQGYVYTLKGNTEEAVKHFELGEKAPYEYCFPNKIEEINILKSAISNLDNSSYASYYLGNLLYDKKQYFKAYELWKNSTEQNPSFAMAYRNMSIYNYNKEEDIYKAIFNMEKAYNLDPDYPRHLLEYDQLNEIAGASVKSRLDFLEKNIEVVKSRDALFLQYITLLNSNGEYEKAYENLMSHIFHPWEGGEGKASTQYKLALTEMAKKKISINEFDEAIDYLNKTFFYPTNLGEGKLPNVKDNIANYYLGLAYRLKGKEEKSKEYLLKASVGLEEPSLVLYYNDHPSDTMFYQGLANILLENPVDAKRYFNKLIFFGGKHIFDEVKPDYFAVSLPEIDVFPGNMKIKNDIYCKYLIALGYIGLNENNKASKLLDEILSINPNYQGAIIHKKIIDVIN